MHGGVIVNHQTPSCGQKTGRGGGPLSVASPSPPNLGHWGAFQKALIRQGGVFYLIIFIYLFFCHGTPEVTSHPEFPAGFAWISIRAQILTSLSSPAGAMAL